MDKKRTKYTTFALQNGLRVIHRWCDSPIVYCGYQIAAGTANEEAGEEGLAHFLEHVTFKGTARRTSLQIINCIEGVGGELNAFTNKTSTVFYCSILREYFPRAVDLLSDIVFHSTYPQSEIDKEVEVICDEIESYNDSPSELIYDEFENILFKGTPLGHNILGTAETVRSFKTADAQCFASKYYRPDNAIFFVYGDVDADKIKHLLEKYSPVRVPEILKSRVPEIKLITHHSSLITLKRDTHQSHVMLGTRLHHITPLPCEGPGVRLLLLNNILGGPSMNARLNLALREKAGLVYTVESTISYYSPPYGGGVGGEASCGEASWSVYFGCDRHDVKRCLRLVRKELDKLTEKPLSDRQLSGYKQQIKGQLALACENKENFALDFGKSFLHYGWERDIESLYEKIDALTPADIQQAAKEIFSKDKITTLIIQ